MRLTEEEMAEMDRWPPAKNELGRLAESRARSLLAEVRERRAADLKPDEIEALRTTRDEVAHFDFLPEIPRLIAVLDKLIDGHAPTPPSAR